MAVVQPNASVPIGHADVSGRRVPITVNPEYLRYFSLLGSGVNGGLDHGSFTGLADDDHPQYLNTARGDARYAQISTVAAIDVRLTTLESQALIPVGGIHITVSPTNPATTLGYGTWSAFGTGRVLVGVDVGDTDFDTVEETGGSKTATYSPDYVAP